MDEVELYKQMTRMGPRRSGRSVGNIVAADNVAGSVGRAVVVVASGAHIAQAQRDIDRFTLNDGVYVTSLQEVRSYRGPFMLDHYAVERVVSSLTSEISTLRKLLQEYEARFIS